MKKFFLFSTLTAFLVFYSCQKEKIQKPEAFSIENHENLIKAISESENYHEWAISLFAKLKIGMIKLNSQSLAEVRRFEEMGNRKENLSKSEFDELLRTYEFTSKEELVEFMENIISKQMIIHNEFPILKEKSSSEVGIILGKAFEQCDSCIKDIFGFDAKTGTFSDDQPDGFISQIFSCASAPGASVIVPLDPTDPILCCSNWNGEIAREFQNCANTAIGLAIIAAVGCASGGATIAGETSVALSPAAGASGPAAPLTATIIGGISIFAGGAATVTCLYGVNLAFGAQCDACKLEAAQACIYEPCG